MIYLLILILLWLILMIPQYGRSKRLNAFDVSYIAHRGLHNIEKSIPENSLPAFQRAIDYHYPIELDVMVTKDNIPVVHHDFHGERSLGIHKNLTAMTLSEIQSYPLFGTKHHVPTLEESLKLVHGQVPLLIEIKSENIHQESTKAIAKVLKHYQGPYAIQSFNPLVLLWYKKHQPQVLRGLLSTNYFRDATHLNWIFRLILEFKITNLFVKPDFISFHRSFYHDIPFLLLKYLYHMPCAGWTFRSPKDFIQEQGHFLWYIFEGFLPEEVLPCVDKFPI